MTFKRTKGTIPLSDRQEIDKMIAAHNACCYLWNLSQHWSEFPSVSKEFTVCLRLNYSHLAENRGPYRIHPKSIKFLPKPRWPSSPTAKERTSNIRIRTFSDNTTHDIEFSMLLKDWFTILELDQKPIRDNVLGFAFDPTHYEDILFTIESTNLPMQISPKGIGITINYEPKRYIIGLILFEWSIPSPLEEIDFMTPKVGTAHPKVVKIDINTHIPPKVDKLIEEGLGFVPIKYGIKDLNPISELLSSRYNLPSQWISELIESLEMNKTRSELANGLTRATLHDLKSLSKKIIIKPSDKGGRIILMSKDFYKRNVNKLLLSTDYQIEKNVNVDDLSNSVRSESIKLINSLKRDYNKFRVRQTIKETSSREQRLGLFYGLPKIHKSLTDPPFRPVVSQINHPTAPLARLIDKIIQDNIYKHNPHLLTSTHHALERFKEWDRANTILVSFDVKSLYTSIPLDEGIVALGHESLNWNLNEDERRILTIGSPIVLYNNVFQFGETCFRQLKGVAMGSPFGPSFANTFMLQIDRHILSLEGVYDYVRYIDDILILADTKVEVEVLNNAANSINESIQFELVESGDSVDFLDLTVSISNGSIATCIYEKEISSLERYISRSSLHEKNMLRGVAIGAFKRTLSLCSDLFSSAFYIQNTIYPRLKAKKLPRKLINEAFALSMIRKRKKKEEKAIRIIMDAHPNSDETKRIIKEWFSGDNPKIGPNGETEAQIVFRNYPNLRKMCTKAKFIDNFRKADQ